MCGLANVVNQKEKTTTLKHVLVGSSDELIFLLMKISLARDPGEPPAYVIKPQDNCKNSRLDRSSPTEGPIQPTGLMTAHTVPSAVHCLSPEALAKSI